MINFSRFEGRLIRMNKEYPICSREDDKEDEIIGYTSVGDMAVITFADINKCTEYKSLVKISDDLGVDLEFGIPVPNGREEGYFETIIVSGKYIGVDSLALNLKDIANSTFILNKIDGENTVYIQKREVNYEYV